MQLTKNIAGMMRRSYMTIELSDWLTESIDMNVTEKAMKMIRYDVMMGPQSIYGYWIESSIIKSSFPITKTCTEWETKKMPNITWISKNWPHEHYVSILRTGKYINLMPFLLIAQIMHDISYTQHVIMVAFSFWSFCGAFFFFRFVDRIFYESDRNCALN